MKRSGFVVVGEDAPLQFWAPGPSGVNLANDERIIYGRSFEYAIRYFDFESGRVSELLRDKGPFGRLFLAASPAEDWLLFSEVPLPRSELMLMENFR